MNNDARIQRNSSVIVSCSGIAEENLGICYWTRERKRWLRVCKESKPMFFVKALHLLLELEWRARKEKTWSQLLKAKRGMRDEMTAKIVTENNKNKLLQCTRVALWRFVILKLNKKTDQRWLKVVFGAGRGEGWLPGAGRSTMLPGQCRSVWASFDILNLFFSFLTLCLKLKSTVRIVNCFFYLGHPNYQKGGPFPGRHIHRIRPWQVKTRCFFPAKYCIPLLDVVVNKLKIVFF